MVILQLFNQDWPKHTCTTHWWRQYFYKAVKHGKWMKEMQESSIHFNLPAWGKSERFDGPMSSLTKIWWKELKRVSAEVKTRRLIGHVLCMERNSHCRTALTWQPEGKRRRGWPRATWRRIVEHERKEMGIASWEIARNMTWLRNR